MSTAVTEDGCAAAAIIAVREPLGSPAGRFLAQMVATWFVVKADAWAWLTRRTAATIRLFAPLGGQRLLRMAA